MTGESANLLAHAGEAEVCPKTGHNRSHGHGQHQAAATAVTLTEHDLLMARAMAEIAAEIAAEIVLERLASDLLAGGTHRPAAAAPRLVSPAELARVLGVGRDYMYDHQEELGVRRLGGGDRPRLWFDLDQALAAFAALPPEPPPVPARPRHRRRAATTTGPLLPIGGKRERAQFTLQQSP